MYKILSTKENVFISPILKRLNDSLSEYSFLLLHCYAHIKNAEIYYEIDKDIYEHVIIYDGDEFLLSCEKYFFQFKMGAILAYKNDKVPFVKMTDFTDPNIDYAEFIKDIKKLPTPEFIILGDFNKKELISTFEF